MLLVGKKMNIPYFNKEKELGLSEKIAKGNRITYASLVHPNKKSEFLKNISSYHINKSLAFHNEQIDLYPLKSLLVSTGWNLNDDVFDLVETWKARSSPEDKPFNKLHEPRKIIGHSTDTWAVADKDAEKIIDINASIDDLPDELHLVTTSVLYKFLGDLEIKEEMDQLFAEIEQGKWYVSMECIFNDFDYAIIDNDNSHKIVKRNNDTAFLTANLRAYGGNGKYGNAKIGRLIRNLTFSGQGLVKEPGNPNSIIFAKINKFSGELGYNNLTSQEIKKEESKIMADTNENVVLQKQVAELELAKKELERKLADIDEKAQAAQVKNLEDKISELKNTVAGKGKEIEDLNTKLTESGKSLAEAQNKASEIEKQLAEVNKKVQEQETEKKLEVRAQLLVDQKKSVSLKNAQKLVSVVSGLNDEKFSEFVESLPEVVEAKSTDDSKTQADAALDNAKPDAQPALGVGDDDVKATLEKNRVALVAALSKGE